MRTARAVASLGGVGFLRPAPGTWGSLAVMPLAWLGPVPCLLLGIAFAVGGFWAVWRLGEDASGDPGWIVVDEAAGQCIALACVSATAVSDDWAMQLVLAFALFRAFDILKPGPILWADRREGALGVMLDDLIAGAFAGAGLLFLRAAVGL